MPELLEQLANEMVQMQKRAATPYGLSTNQYGMKAAGTPSETAYLYEEGGLFGRCDGVSTLINALVGPVGFEQVLQWDGTDTEKTFVDAWTSIGTAGVEQNAACGDCITPNMSACQQHYCFGRFCRQTEELQFDRIGVRANSSINPRVLFGNITNADGNVVVAQGETITDGFTIQLKTAAFLSRTKLSEMLWNGNPVNNDGRIYQEFNGFNQLVNSGKVDDLTQLACDGLDSFLLDYANNNPQSDGALAITNYFRRIENQLVARAEGAGLDWNSATMHIVMTRNAWDCISRAYACGGIDLCTLSGSNTRLTANADQALDRLNEFLDRMALPINGRWYPVVIDNQIVETTGQANGICSDVFFIVTQINGETITFGQYQDFNMTYGNVHRELTQMFGGDDIMFTDNGRFALIHDNTRGCFDVQILIKPRLVMLMPFLAGRLQNVCCNVLGQPFPDPTASGRTYELGGGRTTSPIPTLYGC